MVNIAKLALAKMKAGCSQAKMRLATESGIDIGHMDLI